MKYYKLQTDNRYNSSKKSTIDLKHVQNSRISHNAGFTLVETLVALIIFSTSLVFLISVAGGGINNITYLKNRLTASYLAQEGIELVRDVRDTKVITTNSWSSFSSYVSACTATTGCDVDPATLGISPVCASGGCPLNYNSQIGYYSWSASTPTLFHRSIVVTTLSSTEVKVVSTVTWPQGFSTSSVQFEENLTCWQGGCTQ